MKPIITIILFCLCLLLDLSAKNKVASVISTDNLMVERYDNEMFIRFTFTVGKNVVAENSILYIYPLLINDLDTVYMAGIAVRGSRYEVIDKRHVLSSGKHPIYPPFCLKNGQSIDYEVALPYDNWMDGARIDLWGVKVGCCSAVEVSIGTIANNIMTKGEGYELVFEEEITKKDEVVITTGDRLARKYPFLTLKTERMPDFSEMEIRKGAITIYFRQGERIIDYNYKDNMTSLVQLITAVKEINASSDSYIEQIVIAGFASPEGSLSFNEQLAGDRADALRHFIFSYSPMPATNIYLYNGGIDWNGLYYLVEQSEMIEKYQLMDIIKNVPVWNARLQVGRHGELIRLNNGKPYRFMYNHFFPLLRNAAYIKVYYRNIPND